MQKLHIVAGAKYGRLTTLRQKTDILPPRECWWYCQCECGNTTLTTAHRLFIGKTKSCGCLSREMVIARSVTHGHTRGGGRTPEYSVWCGMKQRCFDKSHPAYKHYGGRGITICRKWAASFPAFLNDMGKKPSQKHWIERVNNNGDYKPSNCRWATQQEQMNNTRSNHVIVIDGKKNTLSNWCREYGICKGTVKARICRGYSDVKAITSPIKIEHRPHSKKEGVSVVHHALKTTDGLCVLRENSPKGRR